MKNDIRDATLLADLLRMGRLPESWVAPPEVRELREMVRYRAKLARLRSGLKAQVHQTLGKEGVIPELDSIWRAGGQHWLNELRLGDVYIDRIESLRDLIDLYDREITHAMGASTDTSRGTPATKRSKHYAGSARYWPLCSSPRSVTSPGSTTRAGCAHGPG